MVKNPPANAGDKRDKGSFHDLGTSLGGGNGSPLQDSCLENPMDRGKWQAIVPRIERVGYRSFLFFFFFLINLGCF